MNIKTTSKQYLGYVLTGLNFQCYEPILFFIQKNVILIQVEVTLYVTKSPTTNFITC